MLITLLASMAGCSSLSVKYDYDQDANWVKYRTYGWMEKSQSITDPTSVVADTGLLQQLRARYTMRAIYLEPQWTLHTGRRYVPFLGVR